MGHLPDTTTFRYWGWRRGPTAGPGELETTEVCEGYHPYGTYQQESQTIRKQNSEQTPAGVYAKQGTAGRNPRAATSARLGPEARPIPKAWGAL